MGANPQNIWSAPAYLPYLQPPLTNEMVAIAERKLGFRLPQEYLDLLRVQNGGYIRYSLPDCVHDVIAGIGPNFPSITAFTWDDYDYAESLSFSLDGLVPLDGDGHWHLCLDYRQIPEAPAVTYIDTESDFEERVAATFGKYLSLLKLDVEDEVVLLSVSDLKSVIANLSDRLKIKPLPPDMNQHGYPIYGASNGSRKDPQYVWASPNKVPRGFVRKDDPRYEELRNLLPGETLRFPELPESSYVFGTSGGILEQALEACKLLGLDIKPMREYLA
jgi:hypothetical protein